MVESVVFDTKIMKYKTQKYLPKYLCPIYYFLFDVKNIVKTKRPS